MSAKDHFFYPDKMRQYKRSDRVGELIKSTFVKLFEQKKITSDILRLLQDKAYSSNNFSVSSATS